MEDGYEGDPDPAAAGTCPCCSSSPAVVRWRRSVKRRLDGEKGEVDGEEGGVGPLARVGAEDETEALREALAAAQDTAAALQGEVEEERLAAASAASEAMAMMLRLQRDKADVQMELRQFRRFADEKMALDAAEIDHLRALVDRRVRYLACVRSRLRNYQQTCLRLGIPLPDGEDEEQDQEDGLFLEGEDGDCYPQLRCYDGEYYYEDVQEGGEEDVVAVDLERRICLLENGQDAQALGPSLKEEEEGTYLHTEELPELAGQKMIGQYSDEELPKETVLDRSHFCNDNDEPSESSAAEYDDEDGGSDNDGVNSGSGSDRVYTIDKVYQGDKMHQGVASPSVRVLENYKDEEVEPDIQKLYMRLEALEADRELMRQALVGMRTEKAQLMLLQEIAQQLAKDVSSAGMGGGFGSVMHHLPGKQDACITVRRVREDKKTLIVRTFSTLSVFKWVITLFCSKRKPSQSRYTFGLSSHNVGLLLLLDKCPRIQKIPVRTK